VGFNLQLNVAYVPDPVASFSHFLRKLFFAAPASFLLRPGIHDSGCSESSPNGNHSQIQDLSLQATARLLNLSPLSGRELRSLALRSLPFVPGTPSSGLEPYISSPTTVNECSCRHAQAHRFLIFA
jgi:hypothetical protein